MRIPNFKKNNNDCEDAGRGDACSSIQTGRQNWCSMGSLQNIMLQRLKWWRGNEGNSPIPITTKCFKHSLSLFRIGWQQRSAVQLSKQGKVPKPGLWGRTRCFPQRHETIWHRRRGEVGLNTPGGDETQVRHMRVISIETDWGRENSTRRRDRAKWAGREIDRGWEDMDRQAIIKEGEIQSHLQVHFVQLNNPPPAEIIIFTALSTERYKLYF